MQIYADVFRQLESIGLRWERTEYIHESAPEFLHPSSILFLFWLARSHHCGLDCVEICDGGNGRKNTIRIHLTWREPLHEQFAMVSDEPVEIGPTQLTNLAVRSYDAHGVSRMDFKYRVELFVQKPKAPAKPREMDWVFNKLLTTWRGLGLSDEWLHKAIYYFKNDTGLYIPNRRDLAEDPLRRRIKTRSNECDSLSIASATSEPDMSRLSYRAVRLRRLRTAAKERT